MLEHVYCAWQVWLVGKSSQEYVDLRTSVDFVSVSDAALAGAAASAAGAAVAAASAGNPAAARSAGVAGDKSARSRVEVEWPLVARVVAEHAAFVISGRAPYVPLRVDAE